MLLTSLLQVSDILSSDTLATKPLPADTVFRNGSIYSLDHASTKYQAMAIKDGYIAFLGSNDDSEYFIGRKTAVFDLEGRMAMPGLVDAHLHMVGGGASLLKCNFNYQPLSLEEVLAHLQGCLDSDIDAGDDDWLEAILLDYSSLITFNGGGVTYKDLDTLKTKRPIVVATTDYHTRWVNSAALKASRITSDSMNPRLGVIERLPGSHEPSGILQDGASKLLTGPAPATLQENIKFANASLKLLRENGITTFQDASSDLSTAEAFKALMKQGDLSARGFFNYRINPPDTADGIPALINDVITLTSTYNDPSEIDVVPILKWHAVKILMDGVISHPQLTGAVIEPYIQQPGSNSDREQGPSRHGELFWSEDILTNVLEELFLRRIDAQVHVDGDLAVRTVLNALQGFRARYPGWEDYKIGLAHNELTHPDDWPRFAELKASPIMSFQWAQSSPLWNATYQALGPERSNYLEAWGEIAKFGAPIIYGSDWPVDPLDEWLALKVGVTRSGDPTNPNSPASEGPELASPGVPGLSLSREDALRAITIESSKFLRADKWIGSLEVGKLADVIVLQSNYFEVPDDEIARQKTLLTMLGGEVVYIADDVDFGNGIVPKFQNSGTLDRMLEKRAVGGFQGKSLSKEGREAVQRLSRRGVCEHGTDLQK